MKKWMKWALAAFVGLAVLGALLPDSDEDAPDSDKAATAQETPAADEAAPEATPVPTPTPKPEVEVNVTGPFETTQDSITLRGTVSHGKAKIRVKGATDIRTRGKRWAADVAIRGMGDNDYRVVATMPGAKPGRQTATVTREQSAAEKAAARAAERDAFIAATTTVPYAQLNKNPERYRGTKVAMRGQILQIQEDFGQTWMLLSVTDEGYGFWTDNVWIDYDGTIQGADEDVITVYGVVKGSKSYETQIGGETYVPKVRAEYIAE